MAEQILIHIRDSILCNKKPSINCSELQNIFDLVYESNFVIVHRGEWRKLSALSQFLTSCGYGTVFYDAQETASNLTTINLSTFCTTRKRSVIISITDLRFAIQVITWIIKVETKNSFRNYHFENFHESTKFFTV